ncbi:hypothetical protein CPC08DRAFT_716738 [Agrocybe pediades]|nr:hypothetical protein CPC08DRAFT_716736 [Agrocybe pediades]KAF9543380.1 hypothetical protein CPC08DRAFT_716738 [Agrocybe pediades]
MGLLWFVYTALRTSSQTEHCVAAAVRSFSKFLCVSSQFCGQHRRLPFKILKTSEDRNVRGKIIIASRSETSSSVSLSATSSTIIVHGSSRFKLSDEEEHADGAHPSYLERCSRSQRLLVEMAKMP